ncbi:MAG: hypothetical protein IPJ33_03370 [Gammaproteobacteria bacterium]|nr:hypothetical protein [Gammaproteobacteria bacterium]
MGDRRAHAVPGVASVRAINGVGGDEELQIVFDPCRATKIGITIPQIAAVAGSANDASGGVVDAVILHRGGKTC